MLAIKLLGFLVLVFLPGAWITFGLPLPEMPFRARLLGGAALSPFIVSLQFYLLRLSGASFDRTVILLIVLNAPALYLVYKRRVRCSLLSGPGLLAAGMVLLVTAVGFAPFVMSSTALAYTGNPWMHAATDYMIANGDLLLEEPQLAGVRLAYPWAGYVLQAVLGYLLGTPPLVNFIWVNLTWVLLFFGLAECIVAEMGGSALARGMAPAWLFFGVNFLGYVLPKILQSFNGISGDLRYTPWVWYFLTLEQMGYAVALLMALTYLMMRDWPAGTDALILAAFLLSGLGIIYPVLYPAGCALFAGKAIAMLWGGRHDARRIPALGAAFLLCSVLVAAYLGFVTRDRVTPLLHFSDIGAASVSEHMHARTPDAKAAEFLVVTGPLLLGLVLSFRGCWQKKRSSTIVLLSSALACAIAYVLLYIPYVQNEYKFVFIAATVLAPFPAIALDPLFHRLGKAAVVAVAAIVLVLALPLRRVMLYPEAAVPAVHPKLDLRNFDLRLDPSELLAGLCDAVRWNTPLNTVLVAKETAVYFVPLTRRKLYVSPQGKALPGVNIGVDFELEGVKGYDEQLIAARRSAVAALFDENDDSRKEQSLSQMLALNRPVALMLNESTDQRLLEWLTRQRKGASIYNANGSILWLVGLAGSADTDANREKGDGDLR